MLSHSSHSFFISDLQELDAANNNWFREDSVQALAGRSLLDALEYLRSIPAFPSRFSELTNAHTIRLICRYMPDQDLDRAGALGRLKPFVLETSRRLRELRKAQAPHYGDDFWDWAAILEAFLEVKDCYPEAISDDAVEQELTMFHHSILAKLPEGLTTLRDGEWYGPATATIAHRILHKLEGKLAGVKELRRQLRTQALERVVGGKYHGRSVEPYQVLWHYGQVVAEFKPAETRSQAKTIKKLAGLEPLEKPARAYALARVIQGAHRVKDDLTVNKCISKLYECQDWRRPLGQGLMADTVKGSLNVLEALWPMLKPKHKMQIRSMIDALLRVRAAANTVGVVVAIQNESQAVMKAFVAARGKVTASGDAAIIEGPDFRYRAVVQPGKSLAAALDAARTLIDNHQARWVIMSGIAGSLGQPVPSKEGGVQFVGPPLGAVVVAASSAPFELRDKVREFVESVKVPFDGSTWMVIPTDPWLFRLAHLAADQLFGESKNFYEGLIVTGTGIKDSPDEKAKILAAFPGGLAVEEEGYLIGLLCLTRRVPYLNIRGISDLAHGDKKNPEEQAKQEAAASSAAQLTVKFVELLSERW
jgi:nucleoside phosphorylase